MDKWLLRLANGVVLVAVGFFVWRAVDRHWTDIESSGTSLIELNAGLILAAGLTVWLTYLLLIAAWRTVLSGWDQEISFVAAVRVWCVSNLGRYLPGKVWAIAGMAIMAKRQGVDGWAAGASALVMQALAVTTGAAVVIATLPALGAEGSDIDPVVVAVAVLAGITGLALLTRPRFMEAVKKLTNGSFQPKPLGVTAVAVGAGATLLSWLAYGLAFWLLARGISSDTTLTLATAVGGFAAGYTVGLIAVFVPGGIGVREGVLIALLAPQIGGPAALVLAAASRLLMTVTEISAAIFAYPLPGGMAID